MCFGDSITEGTEFPADERWTTRLAAHLERRAPGRYRVYNRGVGGETSTLALQRYASAVRRLAPSVVLVEYGLNDANVYDWTDQPRVALDRYADNLARIAGWVRDDGGHCILIVNHSLARVRGRQGNGRDYLANFTPYNSRVIEVAQALNTPYIDLPHMMQARGVAADEFVSSDGVHLSASGNRWYAEMVFDGLLHAGVLELGHDSDGDSARPRC